MPSITMPIADNAVRPDNIQASAVTEDKIADDAVTEDKIADDSVTVDKMDSGTAADGHVATADGAGGVAFEAPTGGGGGGAGTVETELPVSGDGSSGDPVAIENHAISHLKLSSAVAGVNQAAERIQEADGAGGMRWADKGGGGGGGADDGVADSLEVDITGQTLTVTVGRTVGADLEDTATIPDPVSIASLPTQDSPLDGSDLLGIWDSSDGQVEKVPLTVARNFMQDDLDATEVAVNASGFGDNLLATDTNVQLVAQQVNDLALVELSDDDPEDVGAAADDGDGLAASKWNHKHRVPIDNTLVFDGSDQLGVQVQDVIEHLQERIQYHTTSNNYSSSAGATVGQAYGTSQYRKEITKVEVLLNPLVGADGYLVRLDELNDDNSIKAKLFTSNTRSAPFGLGITPRSFTFHDADGELGVIIDGSIRLGILISRIGDNSDSAVAAVHGSEASNSPRESYDDASTDFDLENDVVYQHIDPRRRHIYALAWH